MHFTDFNLSGGCFGTDVIQNHTKWSNIGDHGLIFGPIFAKFQCAFFNSKKCGKWQYGQKKHKHFVFREKIFEKLHASYQSWKKQMFRCNLFEFDYSGLIIYYLIDPNKNIYTFKYYSKDRARTREINTTCNRRKQYSTQDSRRLYIWL